MKTLINFVGILLDKIFKNIDTRFLIKKSIGMGIYFKFEFG